MGKHEPAVDVPDMTTRGGACASVLLIVASSSGCIPQPSSHCKHARFFRASSSRSRMAAEHREEMNLLEREREIWWKEGREEDRDNARWKSLVVIGFLAEPSSTPAPTLGMSSPGRERDERSEEGVDLILSIKTNDGLSPPAIGVEVNGPTKA